MVQQRNNFFSSGNFWISIIILGLILFAIFSLIKFVYWLAAFIVPVLFIATALIDYTVLTGYLNWVGRLFSKDMLTGLIVGVLSIVCSPFLAIGLFMKALLKNKMKNAFSQMKDQQEKFQQQQHKSHQGQFTGEYTDFEEIEELDIKNPPKSRLWIEDAEIIDEK